MSVIHTHPKDCPDQKAAAADRKQHAGVLAERQRQHELLAHKEWLDWFPAPPEGGRRAPTRVRAATR